MPAIPIPEELSIICDSINSEVPSKYLTYYINLLKMMNMVKINFSLYILLNYI